MKTFTIATALIAAAGFATAAPAPQGSGPAYVTASFEGAAGANFVQSFPVNGIAQEISNPLSISNIQFYGGATCYFHGIDNSETQVGPAAETVAVGPPQTQTYGYCQ